MVLHESNHRRATGAPSAVTHSFPRLADVPVGRLCVDAREVSAAVVHFNGEIVLGPSSFHGDSRILTVDVPLLAENTIAVELRGKPCKETNGSEECAEIRALVLALDVPPPPALVTREAVEFDACCSDPTCDRRAYTAAGGVCAGDPRIRGPLAPQVQAAE